MPDLAKISRDIDESMPGLANQFQAANPVLALADSIEGCALPFPFSPQLSVLSRPGFIPFTRVSMAQAFSSFSGRLSPEAFNQVVADGAKRLFGFLPALINPPPFLMDPRDDEVFWIDPPIVKHKLEWDYGMAMEEAVGSEFRQLAKRAFKVPLSMPQQEKLLTELENNPKLVYQSGLSPAKLPELVESNPRVTIEFLLKLSSSAQIREYYNVISNMPVTLHSVEVVNKLTMSCDIPAEYIQTFVMNW